MTYTALEYFRDILKCGEYFDSERMSCNKAGSLVCDWERSIIDEVLSYARDHIIYAEQWWEELVSRCHRVVNEEKERDSHLFVSSPIYHAFLFRVIYFTTKVEQELRHPNDSDSDSNSNSACVSVSGKEKEFPSAFTRPREEKKKDDDHDELLDDDEEEEEVDSEAETQPLNYIEDEDADDGKLRSPFKRQHTSSF